MDINILELLEQNNHHNEEISVTDDLINHLNFESLKFLVKINETLKEKLPEEINEDFLLLNHLIKINKYIKEIYETNITMKNKEIKFDIKEIENLKNLNELIKKLFDLTINSIDNIQKNKQIENMIILEKIKILNNSLFQENYMNTINGKISVLLGCNFINILSNFEKIYKNLEKMIAIFKRVKVNLKNKSSELRDDYDVLVVTHNKHKNSLDINSNTRNHLSLDNGSLKDVNTNDKINKSIY